MKKSLLPGTLLVLLTATVGFANIANPDLPGKKKSIDTSLSIRLDRDATEARLIIPRSQLKQLRAELEQLDEESDSTSAGSLTNAQTIVSGGLLSLGFLFGGMWMFKSGRSKAVVAAVVLIAISSVATLVYANAGPPPAARSISGQMFSPSVHAYKSAWGKIKLEVSDTARSPELIVPDPAEKPDE